MTVRYHLDSTNVDRARDVLMLTGWSFVPNREIRSLVAQVDADSPVRCDYGLPRPDVVTAYQLPTSAANTGFRAQLPLCKRSGTITVRLVAELHDGSHLQICTRAITLGDQHSKGPFPFEISRLDQFPEENPIFVIGMSRSGTSAITLALLKGAGFPGFTEGHLFNVLDEMLRSLFNSWQRQLQQFDSADFMPTPTNAIGNYDIYAGLNRVVASFHEVYHSRFQSNVWVDKTTDVKGVRSVPLLSRIYPRARFLFMHRHPIKVALSRQRKFPKLPLRQSFVEWAECLRHWRTVKVGLTPDSCMEIAQNNLSINTDRVVHALKDFLQLDEPQAASVSRFLKTQRPENTGSSSDSADAYLEDMDWAEADKEAFRSLCLRDAKEMGYQTTRDERDVG